MQGRIGVESQVGQGSTFGLPPSLSDSPQPPKTTSRNMHLLQRRILVVDDTAANREILNDHLRSWGAIPQLAASAG